jgi:hypothetical protein
MVNKQTKTILFFLVILDPSNVANPIKSSSFNSITLKINYCNRRQFTLPLPSSTTSKDLHKQVADRISSSSIYNSLPQRSINLYLIYNDGMYHLDDDDQYTKLKHLKFLSDSIQLLASHSLVKKLKIYIRTSNSSLSKKKNSILLNIKKKNFFFFLDLGSCLSSNSEYTMMDFDRFKIIFDVYQRDMKSTNTRFEFDGNILHPHGTPMDYDMVDGEILDAFILPNLNQNKAIRKKERNFI